MKKGIIFLILLLASGAWISKKFVDRASQSSDALETFQNHASYYDEDGGMFLKEEAKKHHKEAFNKAYRMWKLSPVSELDLTSHYDEKTYYMTLGKAIYTTAKDAGNTDAITALIEIGKHYGATPHKKSKPEKLTSPLKTKTSNNDPTTSPLGKAKLGDKRSLPSSRKRDDR